MQSTFKYNISQTPAAQNGGSSKMYITVNKQNPRKQAMEEEKDRDIKDYMEIESVFFNSMLFKKNQYIPPVFNSVASRT